MIYLLKHSIAVLGFLQINAQNYDRKNIKDKI